MAGRGLTPAELLYRRAGLDTSKAKAWGVPLRSAALRYAAAELRLTGEAGANNSALLLEQLADEQE